MVCKHTKVHERSLMKISMRINSAFMWSLVQLTDQLESGEEIDCDQLTSTLEGLYAAISLGITLKGDRVDSKPDWRDEFDVTGYKNRQNLLSIVQELQDDYIPELEDKGRHCRCLCLRRFLVLERINYL